MVKCKSPTSRRSVGPGRTLAAALRPRQPPAALAPHTPTPDKSPRLPSTRRPADPPTLQTPTRYRDSIAGAMNAFIALVVCLCALSTAESSGAPRVLRRRLRPVSAGAAEYEGYERSNALLHVEPQASPASPWQPISVNIPIPRGAGQGGSVPLVILPLPMPVAAPSPPQTECKPVQETKYEYEYDDDEYEQPQEKPARPSQAWRPGHRRPEPPKSTAWGPVVADEPVPQRYPFHVAPNKPFRPVQVEIPDVQTPFSSQEQVRLFREQQPRAPALPPLLLSEHDRAARLANGPSPALEGPRLLARPPAPARSRSARQSQLRPPTPRITRSIALVGALTVPRADYTEPYTAWYDAASGSVRVDFHEGSASSYRTFLPDGRVQYFEVHVDRSGGKSTRRCGISEPQRADADDRLPPALPDFTQFTFAGYAEGNTSVERWQRQVTGAPGEQGAASGERLTVRHELLLARDRDDHPVPLQYNVATDSSALGADCDGYQHSYLDVRIEQKDAAFFTPNVDELCDEKDTLSRSDPEQFARLDPLREFTLPFRDPKYDVALQKFKTDFNRKYGDDTEEAVRKNLLMQTARFTSSANRQGSTTSLGVNHLGDRLDAEKDQLMGVESTGSLDTGDRFPYSRSELQDKDASLPDSFQSMGVSPVQNQGTTCASCWAFAVAGAVEGALYMRTGRLVPLSPQCLVDCSGPFGGKGCKGTWPSSAYDYVRERGLPALDEYPYKSMKQQCREKEVAAVTRISGHVNVTENSVPALKVAIKEHAPSVVLVDAHCKSFISYNAGVLYDDRCGKTSKYLKHAVLAVGWGTSEGEQHFVLKNSWTSSWGDAGYVRVHAGSNTCGVLTKPSYPRLATADVLKA
ncbi:unnamed protein product [Colias eurytheme]|nr:unnamed protein product [Colias eurytheme]